MILLILYNIGFFYSLYRFFTEPDFEYVGKGGLLAMALFWPAFLIIDLAMHGIRRK